MLKFNIGDYVIINVSKTDGAFRHNGTLVQLNETFTDEYDIRYWTVTKLEHYGFYENEFRPITKLDKVLE